MEKDTQIKTLVERIIYADKISDSQVKEKVKELITNLIEYHENGSIPNEFSSYCVNSQYDKVTSEFGIGDHGCFEIISFIKINFHADCHTLINKKPENFIKNWIKKGGCVGIQEKQKESRHYDSKTISLL